MRAHRRVSTCAIIPTVNEEHIDKELEDNMEKLLKLVVMGRACRNTANIKNRQPIGKMYVKADFELAGVLSGDHRRRTECKKCGIYTRCS